MQKTTPSFCGSNKFGISIMASVLFFLDSSQMFPSSGKEACKKFYIEALVLKQCETWYATNGTARGLGILQCGGIAASDDDSNV